MHRRDAHGRFWCLVIVSTSLEKTGNVPYCHYDIGIHPVPCAVELVANQMDPINNSWLFPIFLSGYRRTSLVTPRDLTPPHHAIRCIRNSLLL